MTVTDHLALVALYLGLGAALYGFTFGAANLVSYFKTFASLD